MKTLLLSRSDVDRLLTMELAVDAVEGAFLAHGRGECRMPAKVYLPLPEHAGDFRAMPAFLAGAAGVKWVNCHPENPARHGLPSVMGLYVLSDPETAVPLAIMDATLLTALRTGAAAGVASKHLARADAASIGFVGCGVQARYLLAAHRVALGREPALLMADASEPTARRFAEEAGGRAVPVEEAAGADIVCTATPSRSPIVKRAWVRDGTHLNAMGADGPGKEEIDPAVLTSARIFIDDPAQAHESGEVNVPLHAGILKVEDIAGTIGQVVADVVPGRQSPSQITVFDSTGLAIQDLALARVAYARARELGIGTELELVA